MVTAIISVMTGIPVKKDVAMTGEITLRGRVLPIGGLKEKMLAALRAGIKTIVIPEENVKDLAEIGEEVKGHLQIVPASRMDDVLKVALTRLPKPVPAEDAAASAPVAAGEVKEGPRLPH
jgi:ATP-dependent Lon protease